MAPTPRPAGQAKPVPGTDGAAGGGAAGGSEIRPPLGGRARWCGRAGKKAFGLLLAPGASASKDQSALVAIDRAVSAAGGKVRRMDFPYRVAGKRVPDKPEVLVGAVVEEAAAFAEEARLRPDRVFSGGRSMGGRNLFHGRRRRLARGRARVGELPPAPSGPARPPADRAPRPPRFTVPLRLRYPGRFCHAGGTRGCRGAHTRSRELSLG